MTTSLRIAEWIYRDLSLRGGFREVTDQVGPSGSNMIVDYWAKRIEEEIGDNRLIKALEEIANDPANAVTHFEDKWRTIAKRALLPAYHASAAAAGVTTLATEGKAVQLNLPTPQQIQATDDMTDRAVRAAFKTTVPGYAPTPNAESVTPPTAIDLDDFS